MTRTAARFSSDSTTKEVGDGMRPSMRGNGSVYTNRWQDRARNFLKKGFVVITNTPQLYNKLCDVPSHLMKMCGCDSVEARQCRCWGFGIPIHHYCCSVLTASIRRDEFSMSRQKSNNMHLKHCVAIHTKFGLHIAMESKVFVHCNLLLCKFMDCELVGLFLTSAGKKKQIIYEL